MFETIVLWIFFTGAMVSLVFLGITIVQMYYFEKSIDEYDEQFIKEYREIKKRKIESNK